LRFLIDEQLPPALARYLSSVGHDAQHVSDIGLEKAPDSIVWREAIRLGAVLVSKDEDFVSLVRASQGKGRLIWMRTGNTSRAAVIQIVGAALPQILNALATGESLVEVNDGQSST
jgi:predicted nuclease of predicted toxin-antitoxin system